MVRNTRWLIMAMVISVMICEILGCICIFLNLFVIVALIRNRKRFLTNVFYLLVLHCSIVDLIRGGCLIVWSSPHFFLLTAYMRTFQERLLMFKSLSSFAILSIIGNIFDEERCLGFSQSGTIMPEMNTIFFSWSISLLFGAGAAFSGFFKSLIYLNKKNYDNENDSNDDADDEDLSNERGISEFPRIPTKPGSGISANVLSMLIIFVLCYICLFTVLICYGTILKTIRDFQNSTAKFQNDDGQRNQNNNSNNPSSIYHKRSSSSESRFFRNIPQRPSSTSSAKGHLIVEKMVNDNTEEDLLRSGRSSTNLPGSPQSLKTSEAGSYQEKRELCLRHITAHRKWSNHMMSRHKYLIVIGTVLFVDILFLFPYSGIQMMAFLHLNNFMETSSLSSMIRWGLQLLIGLHSVFQPLCYFRMKEFRRLACCLGTSARRRTFISSNTICLGNVGIAGGSHKSQLSGKLSVGSKSVDMYSTRLEDQNSKEWLNEFSVADEKGNAQRDAIEQTGVDAVELNDYALEPATFTSEGCYRSRHSSVKKRSGNTANNDGRWIVYARGRKWNRRLSLLFMEEGEEVELELERVGTVGVDDAEEEWSRSEQEEHKRAQKECRAYKLGHSLTIPAAAEQLEGEALRNVVVGDIAKRKHIESKLYRKSSAGNNEGYKSLGHRQKFGRMFLLSKIANLRGSKSNECLNNEISIREENEEEFGNEENQA